MQDGTRRSDIKATLLAGLAGLTAVFMAAGPAHSAPSAPAVSEDGVWQAMEEAPLLATQPERWIVPDHYKTLQLDHNVLRSFLDRAPMEFTAAAADARVVMTIPMPDGTFAHFAIYQSPIMEDALAAKFPEIRTYSGQGIDDPTATMRFDVTPAGFHAMILSSSTTVFVDPFARGDVDHYISYDKRDYHRKGALPRCLLADDATPLSTLVPPAPGTGPSGVAADLGGAPGAGSSVTAGSSPVSPLTAVGPILRRYRLAVAADGEYTAFHGGTVANGLAAVTTSVNRVSGVYERETAVRLTLVANENLIIYTNSATDPYTDSSPSALLTQNQANLDAVIGSANYDIGHVFSTGGGGLSALGVVCAAGNKARSETGSPAPIGDGYDIDYVAHEMGHEFSGLHSFNGTTSSCGGGNRSASAAYEPGSGSTIMSYAGICASEDLQPHSDDMFCAKSYDQIVSFTNFGGGSACATQIATGNQSPVVNAGPSFTIPANTPFTLTATGSDPDGDPITYCWEEFDLGTAAPPNTDDGSRPIFRSFNPVTSPSRTFPKLSDILSGVSTFGESLPTTSRTMNFRVTARDNRANGGGVDFSSMQVTTTAAAGPFVVTQPNTALTWTGNSTPTVTWNVAGTSAAPVNVANVKISLSTDGGNTFPTVLAASTPNDGSQQITVPNITTNTARVKVEAVGNIFFDISNVNFNITTDTGTPSISLGSVVTTTLGSDGDAFVEPHESAKFTITLTNNGTVGASNVNATLTSSTPGVTVVTSQAIPYPALGPSLSASSSPFTFTVGSAVPCGATLNFTLTVTYAEAGGPAVLNFSIPTGEPAAAATTFPYLGAPVAIPDNNASGVNATITVSGVTGTINDLNFSFDGSSCSTAIGSTTVGLDHTWVGDLVARLTSPSGTSVNVTLFSVPGGANNNGHNFCRTTLDDSGASSIQSITPAGNPYSSTFLPSNPLSAFNGINPNGVWTLNVSDRAGQDTGSIRQFSLSIKGLACNSPIATPGAVPGGAPGPGTPLTVTKNAGNVTLAWGASCTPSGVDYAIYQGAIGSYYSHAVKFCTTQGLLTRTFPADPGDLYYLVVPLTADREGSYGLDSNSHEIPPAAAACKPQLPGACP